MPIRELEVPQLGRLFTQGELRAVFAASPGLKVAANKSMVLEAIEDLPATAQSKLRQLTDHCNDRIIEVTGLEIVALLQLLFFGNRHQSLTDFVLTDLGLNRYFPYELDEQTRSFSSRAALQEYIGCLDLSDNHAELIEAGDKAGLVQLARDTLNLEVVTHAASRRWYRHCNALARDLERLQESELALALYEGSNFPPARERRARILERQAEFHQARTLCGEILASPWCEQEREAAARILPRVQRALGETPARRRADEFERLELELTVTSLAVEAAAAAELAADWQSVHFVENKLMNALFGLAFWEQIFAPLSGAFNNPYQAGPTDMFEPDFRGRRGVQLERRIEELRRCDLVSLLPEAYCRYTGYRNYWVDWRVVDVNLVAKAAAIIPREHLLAVWERLLFDPRENRSGFPDLLALGRAEGEYQLIEVKGPGDTLRDNQKRWLRFFSAQGLPAAVAWVKWCDA